MKSVKELLFGAKSVPYIGLLTETTRQGIHKGYIPKFLYKPPYGYPRYTNLPFIRNLARTPYVEMCIDTIDKEVTAIPWDIVINPDIENGEELDDPYERMHIKHFLQNPNPNPETFEQNILSPLIRDVLEVNAGIINKIFNLKKQMVGLKVLDGATFTKNPDIHGMYTDRADILVAKNIVNSQYEVTNPWMHIDSPEARSKAAYFQYGWVSGPIPVPFGKREIVWVENIVRSDEHYGESPVEYLANTLQMLLWQIESDLDYYNQNNVPKGMIGLEGSDSAEIEAFKEQWNGVQQTNDEFGRMKKMMHKVPILNHVPHFERIEFSSSEMQIIEKQNWYTKMVWAAFGVTSTELGYTIDAKGSANQIVQSKVFRKKAILPLINRIKTRINRQIIPEFEYTATLKTDKGEVSIPKYVFKWLTEDLDEERNKYELYKLKLETINTINEVRQQEGLKAVPEGDTIPGKQAENSFSFGGMPDRERDAQDTRQSTSEPQTEDKSGGYEHSPIVDYDMNKLEVKAKYTSRKRGKDGKWQYTYNDGPRDSKQKVTDRLWDNLPKKEKELWDNKEEFSKEMQRSNPKKDIQRMQESTEKKPKWKSLESTMLLEEGEIPSNEKEFYRYLKNVLKLNEEKILNAVETEIKPHILKQIKGKGLNEIIERLKSILTFAGLRQVTQDYIQKKFTDGSDAVEEKLEMNFMPDQEAIKYISDYTFDQVKGITEDLADKLSDTMKRSFMAGQGTDQIKKEIKQVFDVMDNRAEAIARTESSRAMSMGKLNAYKQSGLQVKKWLEYKLDNRTSDISKRLHEKYGTPEQAIPLDENFEVTLKNGKTISGQAPPFHVNERDTLMFTTDDE
jgi:SPP1 gp7 family putative phage head morphogenesis protein